MDKSEAGKSEHGLRNPKAVAVLVSFDGWHSETAFKQPDGTYVCSLMCPPRAAFEYCFEVTFTEVVEPEDTQQAGLGRHVAAAQQNRARSSCASTSPAHSKARRNVSGKSARDPSLLQRRNFNSSLLINF